MNIETRHTTTLIEIRDFLEAHGGGPGPWSSSESAIDGLLELLRERADDDDFWQELTGLIGRLHDARVHPRLLGGSDLVDGATTAELVAKLRTALPQQPTPARGWGASLRGAGALAAFLVLGTAVSCQPSLGGGDGDPDCPEAPAGLTEGNAEVYCELADFVNEADVSEATRDDVFDCLPEMSNAERLDLLDAFRDYTDEELATALEELALDCDPPGDDDDDWQDDDDH